MPCDRTLRLFSLNFRGLRSNGIICLYETYITKDVSGGWEKEWGGKLISNDFTSQSSGQSDLKIFFL